MDFKKTSQSPKKSIRRMRDWYERMRNSFDSFTLKLLSNFHVLLDVSISMNYNVMLQKKLKRRL